MLLKVIINRSQGKKKHDKKLKKIIIRKLMIKFGKLTMSIYRLQGLDGCFNVGNHGWEIHEVDFT